MASESRSATANDARDVSPSWEPAQTYALIVGVLRFADPSITSFSPTNRKDQELYETLAERGVPKDHMRLLLDADATESAVSSALHAVASLAPRGSTLLFYYAGHGDKADNGSISFVAFDTAAKKAGGGIDVAQIGEILASDFHGDRVLLFADSCYSGGLAEVARKLRDRGTTTTALTSAEASNTSTGNWTFTQSLIDGLRGDPLFDHDADGVIRMDELASEERDAMKNREKQRAGVDMGGVDERLALVPRKGPPSLRSFAGLGAVGGYVEARRKKADYQVARVLAARTSELDVEFYDYSDKVTETVPLTAIKPIQLTRYPVGARLEVFWEGKKWPAEVTAVDGDFERITYPGWPSFWDEWILSDRVAGSK